MHKRYLDINIIIRKISIFYILYCAKFSTPRNKFIALSGLGWLLDFVIFGLGVILFEMTAFYSNLFSASFAALFVFLASQILIFKVKKFDTLSLIIYLTYTEINIILWALLIGYIANISSQLIELDIASIMAKIFVTPFSLACNYLVAKSISKKSSNE